MALQLNTVLPILYAFVYIIRISFNVNELHFNQIKRSCFDLLFGKVSTAGSKLKGVIADQSLVPLFSLGLQHFYL